MARRRSYRRRSHLRLSGSSLGAMEGGISWGTLAVGAAAGYGVAMLMKPKTTEKKEETAAPASGGAVSGLGYFGAIPPAGSPERSYLYALVINTTHPAMTAFQGVYGGRSIDRVDFPPYVVVPLKDSMKEFSFYNQIVARRGIPASALAAAQSRYMWAGLRAYLALVSWYSTLSEQQKMRLRIAGPVTNKLINMLEKYNREGGPALAVAAIR